MFCCGGAEEETNGPPSNQYTAPPKAGNPYNGGNKFFFKKIAFRSLKTRPSLLKQCRFLIVFGYGVIGSERGEPRSSNVVKSGAPQKVLPIEIPVVPLDELNRITSNFGSKALIGEGSYGRVFYGQFNGAAAAIKKLDTSSSEPDSDFATQVNFLPKFSNKVKNSTTQQFLITCFTVINRFEA